VNYDINNTVKSEISELDEDELDFIEREIFHAFNSAYEDYYMHGVDDNKSAIVMYERALDTISTIRNIRDELTDEQLEYAKHIRDSL